MILARSAILICLLHSTLACSGNIWQLILQNFLNQNPTTTTTTTTTTTAPGCKCGIKNEPSKIVNGQPADPNEYPWQIGLTRGSGYTPYCGGSIVSSKSVVTAAHCVYNKAASDIWVRIATHDKYSIVPPEEKYVQVCTKQDHESFNIDTLAYDLSVLTLCDELEFNMKVSPVCLPDPGTAADYYIGKPHTTTGWGAIDNSGGQTGPLQELDVMSITQAECCSILNGGNPSCSIPVNSFCTYKEAASHCFGDSGGPLINQETAGASWVLTGVTSYVFSTCADNKPAGFSNVAAELTWISPKITGTVCPSL